MSIRNTLLLSAVCIGITTILAMTRSGADDIQQRTYSDCSPAVASVAGSLTLNCKAGGSRISIPILHLDGSWGLWETVDEFFRMARSNVGGIVFVDLKLFSSPFYGFILGEDVKFKVIDQALYIEYGKRRTNFEREILIEGYYEEDKEQQFCDWASSCNIAGFYFIARADGNYVKLKHVASEKILLSPKYDSPR
jgi:hypothetical protein